jgi:hypothetical protein
MRWAWEGREADEKSTPPLDVAATTPTHTINAHTTHAFIIDSVRRSADAQYIAHCGPNQML